jgi:hypothetical protein
VRPGGQVGNHPQLGLANANALIRYAVRWVDHHPDLKVTFLGEAPPE